MARREGHLGIARGRDDAAQLAQRHAWRQEGSADDCYLRDEEAIAAAAEEGFAAWVRSAKSYAGSPSVRHRYVRTFVHTYEQQAARGLPPFHRRCLVCGHTGEDVHLFQLRRDSLLKQLECDDVDACADRLLRSRRGRRRVYREF